MTVIGTVTQGVTVRDPEEDPNSDALKAGFAQRIDVLIRRHGSATEVARLAHVSEAVVRKWRRGDSIPGLDLVVRLAQGTGVSLEWLALGAEGPPPTPVAAEPTSRYGAVDVELLVQVIDGCDEYLSRRGQRPSTKRRAELYALTYAHFEGRDRADDAFARFLDLVTGSGHE